MMLEVRTNPFALTSNLMLYRFHQGHSPPGTFFVNPDDVASAQSVWQSFSIMQICWGAIDHGYGNFNRSILPLIKF